MGKYFGTDGVRGLANDTLTPEFAFKLGRVAGYMIQKEEGKEKVLIGLDTRVSGPMYEGAILSGLISSGADVMLLGVLSTPAVAYLTKIMDADMGIMVSASHNPFDDNGIKIFGPNGFKLKVEEELEIEALLEKVDELPRATGAALGTLSKYFEGAQKYLSYLKETVDNEFTGLHVGVDCANGATTGLASHLFADLDAEITVIGSHPDGININDGVGSTHPEKLQALVKEKNLDIGVAFDGDGDRLIAIDENGDIVDGDHIMYICAKYMKEMGQLKDNTIVVTVMSNIGLIKKLEEIGIEVVTTDVGDKQVLRKMRDDGYNFGGEQSGHMIFLDHIPSGDGMLTAIQLINVMKEKDKKLSELAAELTVYPQLLKNIKVKDKKTVLDNKSVKAEIEAVKTALGDEGRILVRPSGTEELIRVMVEAETEALCEEYVNRVITSIKNITTA